MVFVPLIPGTLCKRTWHHLNYSTSWIASRECGIVTRHCHQPVIKDGEQIEHNLNWSFLFGNEKTFTYQTWNFPRYLGHRVTFMLFNSTGTDFGFMVTINTFAYYSMSGQFIGPDPIAIITIWNTLIYIPISRQKIMNNFHNLPPGSISVRMAFSNIRKIYRLLGTSPRSESIFFRKFTGRDKETISYVIYYNK